MKGSEIKVVEKFTSYMTTRLPVAINVQIGIEINNKLV
jgi:hypothetical protein